MNEHCKYCSQPRKPRHDRPGRFFTLCADHYAEYQRVKNRESYARHKEKRQQNRRDTYWADPEKGRAVARKSAQRPEARERKRKYMELYLRPYRAFIKDACERCGWVAQDRRQLDGHHKDGNHDNNDPENIETLCPPCHRIVDHAEL